MSGFDPIPDSDTAVSEGVFGENGQTADRPLMIGVDWRTSSEIEWQANAILAAWGIKETWRWRATGEAAATVMHAFADLSNWLASRGLVLLHLDLGGDSYQAFLVEADQVQVVTAQARAANLKLFTHEAFRAREDGH